MCGRYTLTDPGDLLEELDVEAVDHPFDPRYNIAPTQAVPVIRATPDGGGRQAIHLHWGLIPFWAKERSIGNRMINARSETAAQKPSFRNAMRRRRCLVLADGFYEWRKLGSGPKQPYHIHRPDRRPFTMAGLWERWDKGPDGPIESCTILTTAANATIAPLHDRMPVILTGADRDRWLDPGLGDAAVLNQLLVPAADDALTYTPVSRRVNSPRNDDPACLEPVEI